MPDEPIIIPTNRLHFHAGHNDAGYMPESGVETFPTFAGAAAFLAEELRHAADSMETWADEHDCDDIPCPTFGDECAWQLAGAIRLAAEECESESGPEWFASVSDGRSLPVSWWVSPCYESYCNDSDDDESDDDDGPSPRDLPPEVAEPVIATDHQLVGSTWEEIFPEPGGSWGYGRWEPATPETATHFLISPTCYSDYSGGTVERSNRYALQEDYPDTFTEAHGGYGTYALMLSADWSPPGDGRDDLIDVLAGLGADGYPVYDEEHLCRLEMEIAEEAWEQYLRYDVMRELDELGVPDDVLDNIDDDVLRERVYRGIGDSPEPYHAESAIGVVFPYLSDVLAEIASELTPEGPAEDDDAPMQCDGQMSFDDGPAEN